MTKQIATATKIRNAKFQKRSNMNAPGLQC